MFHFQFILESYEGSIFKRYSLHKQGLFRKKIFLNSDYFLSGRISLSWIKYAFNFLKQQYCFKTSSNFKLKHYCDNLYYL